MYIKVSRMKKVRDFIEKHQMITTEDHIIAGISGGADSVCLFFVLLDIRSKQGIPFTAVHVNHGLRGKAADRDEAFVRNLCDGHGVKLEVFRVDLESIAKKRKQSLEESGRDIRREAFEEALKKHHGTKIALAHHQNDNAETLLWNLARGTGLSGICGIHPVNGIYIRPLLCLDRSEIEHFLRQRGQKFCTDDTNSDTEYTRNKLRHLVIPVLEKEVNSRTVRHMNEVMEQLRDIREYMEADVQKAFRKYVKARRPDTLLIKDALWEKEPDILSTLVIRRALEMAAGQKQDVGRTHILSVLGLFEKQSGKRLDLPFSMHAVRVYDGVELYRIRENDTEISASRLSDQAVYPLCIPGEIRIPEWNLLVRCKVFPKTMCFSQQEIPQKEYTKWFDYDIIKTMPCIRTRQGGDHISIDQEGHRQKLKSWFINEKISARERDLIPCIASGSEILWILGHRMSSKYQISSHTKQILQIEVVKEEHRSKENSSAHHYAQ